MLQHFRLASTSAVWVSDLRVLNTRSCSRRALFDGESPRACRSVFFLPEAQLDFPLQGGPEMSPGSDLLADIVIITEPGASLFSMRVGGAMASVDPNLPVVSTHALKEQVDVVFRQRRLIARLASLFGFYRSPWLRLDFTV